MSYLARQKHPGDTCCQAAYGISSQCHFSDADTGIGSYGGIVTYCEQFPAITHLEQEQRNGSGQENPYKNQIWHAAKAALSHLLYQCRGRTTRGSLGHRHQAPLEDRVHPKRHYDRRHIEISDAKSIHHSEQRRQDEDERDDTTAMR